MTAAAALEKLMALDVQAIVATAFDATAADYIALNEKQWAEGKTSQGTAIMPSPYSPGYARQRKKWGLQTDHIDLYRTGDMYKGYQVKLTGATIDMSSDVAYEKYVSKRYDGIYGLDNDNIADYQENSLRPVLAQEMEAQGFAVNR